VACGFDLEIETSSEMSAERKASGVFTLLFSLHFRIANDLIKNTKNVRILNVTFHVLPKAQYVMSSYLSNRFTID
jgi:hypothetical protein